MEEVILTKSEQKTFDILLQKSGMVTSRDEIARSVWGDRWLQKYSDWQIDRLVYLLRRKLPSKFHIRTLRNSGYILNPESHTIPNLPPPKALGTLPTKSYLAYMNNPHNKRKVLADLFASLSPLPAAKNILVINSYSFDNVDAVARYYPRSTVYFSNFDQRALDVHQQQIDKLRLTSFHTTFDDIRDSIFKDNCFDLIISDFRLNFNTTNAQNIASLANTHRLLKPRGQTLISVVVDPRFESRRFGQNQELAPTNKDKPWKFVAEENLERKCFTIPYYRNLFTQTGFKISAEFDIDNGKNWHPPYRRFLLVKVG